MSSSPLHSFTVAAIDEVETARSEFAHHQFTGSVEPFDEADDDRTPSAVVTAPGAKVSPADRATWLVALHAALPDLSVGFDVEGLRAPGLSVKSDGDRMGPMVERLVDLAADQEPGAELVLEGSSANFRPLAPFLDITTDGTDPMDADRPDWHRVARERLS